MSALEFFMLGSLGIRYDSQPLPKPPTLKSQSLLAYLASHRQQPQTREHLANLFWGDRPERRARRSLTTALWHIRRCLPPSDQNWLLSDVHVVQFNPNVDIWLDVAEFESLATRNELSCLQSAVMLYRGDFLDGFYDDWVLNERYQLDTLFSEALARLMRKLELGGDHEGALSISLRLLQRDPLWEDAHQLAMRTFCHLGQRNAALEQYRRCRTVLQNELGAEPTAETTELYQAILDGRVEIEKPVESAPTRKEESVPHLPAGYSPLDSLVRSSLVGRESEMAYFRDRYESALAGRGGLVLVYGEAGVGKTRLVEELADQLRWQGVRVLWGRCYEFERVLPYQPISEALQAVLSSMPSDELSKIPSWILSELVHLVPALSENLPNSGANSEIDLEQAQTRLYESVAHFLSNLAMEEVLVLILDDIHWATESTLQMLHYLTRHLAEQRVLMVGTLRPEMVGPSSAFHSFQSKLGQEGLVQSWNLTSLSLQAIESLVIKMSGHNQAVVPLARRLYEETEGNPFFLMEIIKTLFEAERVSLEGGTWRGDFARISEAELPLPTGVSEAVQIRVHRLDEDAQSLLSLAAVLGREFDFDLLDASGKQDEEATLSALETLLRRRFVSEGSGLLGRDYAFHHHKIQEVVYTELPLRRRQLLHARVGGALEKLYSSNIEAVAGELAFHFSRSRGDDRTLVAKAIRYLLLAGDRARLAYANREAIDYYNQALVFQKEQSEYEQAGRTLMKLGLAYHNALAFKAAHQAYEEGFAFWQRTGLRSLPTALPPVPHALRFRWRCPHTLDPGLFNDVVSHLVVSQVFSGLVATTPDLDVVPEVAQSWQILEGGRRYRFHLHPDVRWNDGAPLTAHDFVYAWKRVLNPETNSANSGLLAIKGARAFQQGKSNQVGVRALDDRTLDVELEQPTSHFLYQLTAVDACPVPQHAVVAFGPNWTDVDKIVSNGPFQLEAWDKEKSMMLAQNSFYAGRFQGNVEQVVLHFPQDDAYQDLQRSSEKYQRGDLDILPLVGASVNESDHIRRQFPAEYLSAPWLFTVYLGFVTTRLPFDNMHLRQALALGVDRERLANVILHGMYTPGSGGYVASGMVGHSPQIGFPYQPDRAREILATAGYAAGDGLPILEGLTVPPIDPLVTRYLQAQWQENLGLQVEWEVVDLPSFQRRLQKNPPHLFLLAGFPTWPDPSCSLSPAPGRLFTRWTSQAYDELVEQARRTLNQGARLEFLRQADQVLVHESSIIPLFYGRQHLLVKPWVSKFPVSALNRWFWKDTIIQPH